MSPKLTKLWIAEYIDGEREIRAAFSNERRYAVVIARPGNADNVAEAMLQLAHTIRTDPELKPKQPERREVLVQWDPPGA